MLAANLRAYGKQRIQLSNHRLLATEALDKTLHIVRYQPSVLPSVTLAIVIGIVIRVVWVEWLAPLAIAAHWADKTYALVEIVAI